MATTLIMIIIVTSHILARKSQRETSPRLLAPPQVAPLQTLVVDLHQHRVHVNVAVIISLQQQAEVGVPHRPAGADIFTEARCRGLCLDLSQRERGAGGGC